MCNYNEAEMSVWVIGSSSGKEQQCGSHAKMSGTGRHTYVCAESAAKGMSQRTGRSIRDHSDAIHA